MIVEEVVEVRCPTTLLGGKNIVGRRRTFGYGTH